MAMSKHFNFIPQIFLTLLLLYGDLTSVQTAHVLEVDIIFGS